MLDVKPQKGKFTWSNMRYGPGHITTRLDCFIVHISFLILDSTLKSYILPSIISDHKPISLHIQAVPVYGPLPFRFNPLWFSYQEVHALVKSAWRSWILGTPIFIWEAKT